MAEFLIKKCVGRPKLTVTLPEGNTVSIEITSIHQNGELLDIEGEDESATLGPKHLTVAINARTFQGSVRATFP